MEEELGPLPAGRHGFSREQVAHSQRERLIAALAATVAARGYAAATITDITREAQVSRRVFYANFAGKEECFLAAFDVVAGYIRELAAEAVVGETGWSRQAIAVSRSVLAFFTAEPDLARLCLVESQGAGPTVAARFHAVVHEAIPYLRLGRAERHRELAETTEESTIGALVLLASRKVAAGEAERLQELLPDFVEFVLSPYLGAGEAARLGRESA